jgi:hypothetical protein
MPMYLWYQYPLYVVAVGLIAVGMAAGAVWLERRERANVRLAGRIGLVAILAVMAFQAVEPWPYLIGVARAPADSPLRDNKRYGAIGRYLAENAAPHAVVAAHEVGLIGYYSDRRILDLMGLTTPLSKSERERSPLALVLERRPDYFVVEDDIYRGYAPDERKRFEATYSLERRFDDSVTGKATLLFWRRTETPTKRPAED